MAGQLALAMEQGATLAFYFVWSYETGTDDYNRPQYAPYDLTGCTARMQIRAGYGTAVLAEATTENDMIVLEAGAETGRIDVNISAESTDAVAVKKAVADLEIEFPSGGVTRVLDIALTNTLNITRSA